MTAIKAKIPVCVPWATRNIGAVLVTLIAVVFMLPSCGSFVPSERQIAKMLPSKILTYEVAGTTGTYVSEVESLVIERRQTRENRDFADCKITLTDEYLRRTIYLTLHLEYYNKGGWMVDSWERYDNDKIEILKPFESPDEVRQVLEKQGFSNLSFVQSDSGAEVGVDESFYQYVYEVNDTYENVTFSGAIVVSGVISQYSISNYDPSSFLYRWDRENYPVNLEVEWDIVGSWYAQIENRKVSFEILSYNSSTGVVAWSIEDGTYFNSGESYLDTEIPSYYSPDSACLSIFASTYYTYYLDIYPNEASLSLVVLGGRYQSSPATKNQQEKSQNKEYPQTRGIPSENNESNYILPDSNSRFYTKAELENMSAYDLFLARNEIFARHGRGFTHKDLRDYFEEKKWYSQKYAPAEFDSMPSPLNSYEKSNAELIYEIERAKGSSYV